MGLDEVLNSAADPPPAIFCCTTPRVTREASVRLAQYLQSFTAQQGHDGEDKEWPIRAVYTIVQTTTDPKGDGTMVTVHGHVPMDAIQANHTQANQDLSASNNDASHIPLSSPRAANARIPLLPYTLRENMDVRYVTLDVSTTAPAYAGVFSTLREVIEHEGVPPPIDGVMNIYTAPMRGSLLGESLQIETNIVIVDYRTVGSHARSIMQAKTTETVATAADATTSETGGAINDAYTHGRSLTHELGHALGLSHPFDSGVCNRTGAAHNIDDVDIVSSKYPNYSARLVVDDTTHEWKSVYCNYDRDIHQFDEAYRSEAPLVGHVFPITFPYSCGHTHESAHLFMDYAADEFSVAFTPTETLRMRSVVAQSGLFTAITPDSTCLSHAAWNPGTCVLHPSSPSSPGTGQEDDGDGKQDDGDIDDTLGGGQEDGNSAPVNPHTTASDDEPSPSALVPMLIVLGALLLVVIAYGGVKRSGREKKV